MIQGYKQHLIAQYKMWKTRLDNAKPHSKDKTIFEYELKKINTDILVHNISCKPEFYITAGDLGEFKIVITMPKDFQKEIDISYGYKINETM